MILYDCLYPHDRPFTPRAPMLGMSDVLVDGQRFYAVKPNTGGARDLSRYSADEARKWPNLSPGSFVVVNIESVPRPDPTPDRPHRILRSDIRLDNARDIAADAAFIRRTLTDVRAGAQGASVALYGILPTGFNVLNSVIKSDTHEHRIAQAANDVLAIEFGDCLDALCPSLYTNNPDPKLWRRFATHQHNECERIGRVIGKSLPIRPFVSPEIHPSAGGGFLSVTDFGNQIRHCVRLGCDGVVCWYSGKATLATLQPFMDEASAIAKDLMLWLGTP